MKISSEKFTYIVCVTCLLITSDRFPDEITSTFSQFGPVLVDWPRRPDSGVKERPIGFDNLLAFISASFANTKYVRNKIANFFLFWNSKK